MARPRRRESWIPHLVLTLGVLVFAFPIYFALIGSTHDAATIATGRMPLVPGRHTLENYWQTLTSGSGFRVSGTPVRTLMVNSLIMALVINIVAIFFAAFGYLPPWAAAIIHNLGGVLVFLNSFRLANFKWQFAGRRGPSPRS